jgi:mono/diheme cytochrome c family protein
MVVALAAVVGGCGGERAASEDPCLTLTFDGGERRHCRSELLARDDVREIALADDVGSYRHARTVKAVPLAALLDMPFVAGAILEVGAADGFSAPLDAQRLASGIPAGARAHLAIEEPDAPWPPVADGRPSAGTFAIVWEGPGAEELSGEEWPYQIVSLRFTQPLTERYPGLLPSADVPEGDPIRAGMHVFVEHCMPCHRLGGAGTSQLGPDLNEPMSPTEYLAPAALRRLIRDPASVRRWPAAQMRGVSAALMPDGELDALIAYLAHEAATRPAR